MSFFQRLRPALFPCFISPSNFTLYSYGKQRGEGLLSVIALKLRSMNPIWKGAKPQDTWVGAQGSRTAPVLICMGWDPHTVFI